MDMTSEGLGEMFEGDSADTCARKFPLMLMGDERTVQRAKTVSEDPHRRELKLYYFLKKSLFLDIYFEWVKLRNGFSFTICLHYQNNALLMVHKTKTICIPYLLS